MRTSLAITLALAFGCGGEDPPSCQQAISHYYSTGCTYFDGTVNPPAQITQAQMATICQQAAIEAPESCQDDFDAWLVCNNEVMPPATETNCDCSTEFMALLRCE